MPRVVRPPEPEWAQRLHDSLDALGPEYANRVSKARSYARNGAVRGLTVRPGLVAAFVQGGFEMPYAVRLEFPPLPDAVWQAATGMLATRMGVLAQFLAGTVSTEIDDLFAAAGERLLPDAFALPSASTCSCPDWMTPCKHAIAVYLAFLERLKSDPGLLFSLRGRSLEEVVTWIGTHWSAESSAAEANAHVEEGPDPDATTVPLTVDHFFETGAAFETLDAHPEAPLTDGAILRQLGQPPFAAEGEDVIAGLLPAYQSITRQALRLESQSGNTRRRPRPRRGTHK